MSKRFPRTVTSAALTCHGSTAPASPLSNSMSQMTQEQQLEQAVLLPQLLQAQTEPTSHTALIQPTTPHFPRRIQSWKTVSTPVSIQFLNTQN